MPKPHAYPPLFVSHDAVGDGPLARALLDLIEVGVGVKHGQVFCTSEKGQGAEIGRGFNEDIRQHLIHAKAVLSLLTENFWASPFCIGEVGGVWFDGRKALLPILVPPLDYKDLRGVVAHSEALKLGSGADLDRMRDKLIAALAIQQPVPTPKWNSRKDAFVKSLPELLARCPARGPVPRDQHTRLERAFAEYRAEYETLEHENERLKSLVKELSASKNKQEVARITAKHSSTPERFETLARSACDALTVLPRAAQEALYSRERGEDYFPGRDDYDDVQEAVQDGYLNEDHGKPPTLRTTNKRVRAATQALDALSKFLDEPPDDFPEWYEAEYKGEEADITLRPFWARHLTP